MRSRLTLREARGQRLRHHRLLIIGLTIVLLTATVPAHSAGTALSDAQALRIIKDNCEMCHSTGLIVQQRLGFPAWLAEVKKMRAWGTPLPAEEVEPLAAYLSGRYGPEAPPAPPRLIEPREAQASIQPSNEMPPAPYLVRGQRLYAEECASCHGANARGGIGPNLVRRPILYRWPDWRAVITRGRGKMPRFNGLLDDRSMSDVLAWVRTLTVD